MTLAYPALRGVIDFHKAHPLSPHLSQPQASLDQPQLDCRVCASLLCPRSPSMLLLDLMSLPRLG